ncbi:MAG TPA: hypothetical protein DIU41_00525 [Oscillibacter sp.]|nr:hypothetical protein [Oscillibacter sp.]
MIPHFRRSVKMAGQWYRISWKKGQKKTSVNSAWHINSIDFFDVILYAYDKRTSFIRRAGSQPREVSSVISQG